VKDNVAAVRTVTMFEKVKSLPRAEHNLPLAYWNRHADRKQRRLDMGGHVIRAFAGVAQIGHIGMICFWNNALKERIQVNLHIGISVFLDQQGTGRVAQEDCQ